MVNHSDKVNIITKVYGDKINTNFDSKVNQFGNDGALYALILAQEQLWLESSIIHSLIIKSLLKKFVKKTNWLSAGRKYIVVHYTCENDDILTLKGLNYNDCWKKNIFLFITLKWGKLNN